MEKDLKALIELNRDAALIIEKDKVLCANSAAETLFGADISGKRASALLPEHILGTEAERFTASLKLPGKHFSAACLRRDGLLHICLHSDTPAERTELVSDFLMNTMLSSLCNIGLAIDRINSLGGSAEPKQKEYTSILSHNYYQLRHSISNLSTAIAIRDGALYLQRSQVDLARLCSQLISSLGLMLPPGGPELSFSTSLGELNASLDIEKTERIILNLLSNSLRHTPPEGRVCLRLEKSGGNALISVDDSGCGIAPEHMNRIFSRYAEKLEPGKLSHISQGGLGLGVARGLAEAQSGSLIIESRSGHGTSVRVLLPLGFGPIAELRSGAVQKENSGMDTILTEMAFLLPSQCYGPEFIE